MKAHIKDLGIPLDIKSKGLEIQVNDNDGRHLGDLIVTSTSLIWCKGRTSRVNGKRISWNKFAQYMQSL